MEVSVAVRTSAVEPDERRGAVEARVLSRRFLGDAELVEFAVQGAEVPVRGRIRGGALVPGVRDVRLSVRDTEVLVFERSAETA